MCSDALPNLKVFNVRLLFVVLYRKNSSLPLLSICPPIRGLTRLQVPKVRDAGGVVKISVDGGSYDISAGRGRGNLKEVGRREC
jgi:hypothetical protein